MSEQPPGAAKEERAETWAVNVMDWPDADSPPIQVFESTSREDAERVLQTQRHLHSNRRYRLVRRIVIESDGELPPTPPPATEGERLGAMLEERLDAFSVACQDVGAVRTEENIQRAKDCRELVRVAHLRCLEKATRRPPPASADARGMVERYRLAVVNMEKASSFEEDGVCREELNAAHTALLSFMAASDSWGEQCEDVPTLRRALAASEAAREEAGKSKATWKGFSKGMARAYDSKLAECLTLRSQVTAERQRAEEAERFASDFMNAANQRGAALAALEPITTKLAECRRLYSTGGIDGARSALKQLFDLVPLESGPRA